LARAVYSQKKKNLTSSLKLEGFVNLRTLIVSSHELTRLDVSECKNLRELDCSDNDLNDLKELANSKETLAEERKNHEKSADIMQSFIEQLTDEKSKLETQIQIPPK